MNQLVLSGTGIHVPSRTRSSCYRGPKSDETSWCSVACRGRNFTNLESFGFLLTGTVVFQPVGKRALRRLLGRTKAFDLRAAGAAVLSALFLSADVALIERMAGELDPLIVHLGASSELLTPDLVVALRKSLPKTKFMRSVPVTGPEAVGVAQAYDGVVDWILLDSHRTGDVQIGAQGVTHDWSISRKIVESVRTTVILAGGLGPDNVKEAIRSVGPAGVNSKTRTDQEGTHSKNLEKVEAFYRAATSG